MTFLGVLACGVGIIVVTPYIQASCAELYAELKDKATRTGICTDQELGTRNPHDPFAEVQQSVALEPVSTCPSCAVQIDSDHKYCPNCGLSQVVSPVMLDIAANAAEDKAQEDWIGALMDNTVIRERAKLYNRIYGQENCIAYLKEKAKGLGMSNAELTDEFIDRLLLKLEIQ
jgi:hypothetical protein